jgi:hypothetical protein
MENIFDDLEEETNPVKTEASEAVVQALTTLAALPVGSRIDLEDAGVPLGSSAINPFTIKDKQIEGVVDNRKSEEEVDEPEYGPETLARRIIEIKLELDAKDALYKELDTLLMTLQQVVTPGVPFQIDDQIVTLVDNFNGKNTVYRPAAVKHFDVEIISVAEQAAKAAKKKKGAK